MNKLKEYRTLQGLSQEKMARKLGVTLSLYEKVERGNVGASAAFMRKFKKAFPQEIIDNIFFTINSNIVADN